MFGSNVNSTVSRNKRYKHQAEQIQRAFTYSPSSSISRGAKKIPGRSRTPRTAWGFEIGRGSAFYPVGSISTQYRASAMSTRRRYKRKRRYKAGGGAAYSGRLALRKVRRLERKIERKFHELAVNNLALIAATGIVTPLHEVAQGDGRNQRDGNYINPTFMKMTIHWTGQAAAVTDVFRTIIF